MGDIFQDTKEINKKSFINHVFITTEEGKAELLNIVQYSTVGIIPVIILNKLIQKFSPEVDDEKSSLEIVVEVFLQLIIMFCGVVIIHRMITYFPTYSGFKYEELVLTNVILAFLIIVLSIQTKLGLKVSILIERLEELWNGSTSQEKNAAVKKNVRVSQPISNGVSQQRSTHNTSQADYLDGSPSGSFPPAPMATGTQRGGSSGYDNMMMSGGSGGGDFLQPANALLGSSFGAF